MTPTAEYLLPDKRSKNISVSFASQSILMSTCLYLCFHCVSLLCNALRSHCTELIGHWEEISDGQIDPNLITRAYVSLSSWELSENIFQSYSWSFPFLLCTNEVRNSLVTPHLFIFCWKKKGSWVQTYMVCTVCTILTSLKVNIW